MQEYEYHMHEVFILRRIPRVRKLQVEEIDTEITVSEE